MTATIIQFPAAGQLETADDPFKVFCNAVEQNRAEARRGGASKVEAKRPARENPVKPRPRHKALPASGDPLLDGARASISDLINHQRSREDASVSQWLAGPRLSRAWFVRNSDWGIRSGRFGQGGHEYQEGMRLAGEPISAADKDAALAEAIETLNLLGFMHRYTGLGPRNACGSYDKRVQHLHESRAGIALCALGATLARLERFGAIAAPTGAEERERKRAIRAAQRED